MQPAYVVKAARDYNQPVARTIAFFKPCFVLSSFTHEDDASTESTKRTLSEFGLPTGVYAAGRLDYDSEGLLILSDDGAFIHKLTDPAHKLPKTYLAQVEGAPTDAMLEPLRRGLTVRIKGSALVTRPCGARVLPGEPALPAREKPITPHGATAWLELILTEGKKRQVRHMTAAVGLPTLRLVRVRIGAIGLDGLTPGAWRDLTREEVDTILRNHEASHLSPQRQNRNRRS